MKTLALVLAASAMAHGCASTPSYRDVAPGHIALVNAQYPPDADFNAYAYGRGANAAMTGGRTALKGAAVAAFAPLQLARAGPIGAAVGVALAIPLAAAGAVVGGAAGLVHGAATGMASEQVSAIHDPIARSRVGTRLQTAMAERVLASSVNGRHHTVTYLPESGPSAERAAPSYDELRQAGFDSVLELTVATLGFEAYPGDPPAARFGMTLRARVVPLAEGAAPWTQEWSHHGTRRAVSAWQEDDGQLLAQELDSAFEHLAERVFGIFSAGPRAAAREQAPDILERMHQRRMLARPAYRLSITRLALPIERSTAPIFTCALMPT